jgi:hypothetical protein
MWQCYIGAGFEPKSHHPDLVMDHLMPICGLPPYENHLMCCLGAGFEHEYNRLEEVLEDLYTICNWTPQPRRDKLNNIQDTLEQFSTVILSQGIKGSSVI